MRFGVQQKRTEICRGVGAVRSLTALQIDESGAENMRSEYETGWEFRNRFQLNYAAEMKADG